MGDRVSAPASEGVGLKVPPRQSDCTGTRPASFPFQIETPDCEDGPDPIPLTSRQRSIGSPQPIPWEKGE